MIANLTSIAKTAAAAMLSKENANVQVDTLDQIVMAGAIEMSTVQMDIATSGPMNVAAQTENMGMTVIKNARQTTIVQMVVFARMMGTVNLGVP